MVLVMTNGVDIIVSHEITMLILMRLGVVARKNNQPFRKLFKKKFRQKITF
jgi:hypothetical protein